MKCRDLYTWTQRKPKGLDLVGTHYETRTGRIDCTAVAGRWNGQKQWRMRCHCGHEWTCGTAALRRKPIETSCPECRRKARAA